MLNKKIKTGEVLDGDQQHQYANVIIRGIHDKIKEALEINANKVHQHGNYDKTHGGVKSNSSSIIVLDDDDVDVVENKVDNDGTATSTITPKPLTITIHNRPYALNPLLSEEQQFIVRRAMAGESLFFTGAAGTGKSFVLQEIIRLMRMQYNEYQFYVTAPTGIAALPLGGNTIHSFAGIGLGTDPVDLMLHKLRSNVKLTSRWSNVRVLVIDEVSMLPAELLDKLNTIAQSLRRSKAPFGGIQIIMCGDFFQLPPVDDRSRSVHQVEPSLDGKDDKDKSLFAFNAKSWKEIIPNTYMLTKPYRQKSDTFSNMLNLIRIGNVSDDVYQQLLTCVGKTLSNDYGLEPTRLYSKKVEVAMYNTTRLNAIQQDTHTFEAEDWSALPNSTALRQIQNACPAPATLELKIGAQVILLKNQIQDGLVNGSRGKVVAFVDSTTHPIHHHHHYY